MRATGGLACQLEMVTHGHEMRFRVLLLVGVAILTSVTAEFEGAHSTVTHLKCLNPRRRRDIHLLPVGGPHFRMASPSCVARMHNLEMMVENGVVPGERWGNCC